MDGQDTQSIDWSSMSDAGLAAYRYRLEAMRDAGLDNGCREYLLAAVIESVKREVAEFRRAVDVFARAA